MATGFVVSALNHAFHDGGGKPKKPKAKECSTDIRRFYDDTEQSALERFLFGPSYVQGGGGAMELIAGGPVKATKWLLRLFGGKGGKSFFSNTKYTNKVLGQIKKGDFHAFPESVKAFESSGTITTIKGGDGITRQMLKIPGSYGGKQGFFEFIKDANGTINHRLFRPLKSQ